MLFFFVVYLDYLLKKCPEFATQVYLIDISKMVFLYDRATTAKANIIVSYQ